VTNDIQITDRGGIYRGRFHGGNIVGFGSCPEDAVDRLRVMHDNWFGRRAARTKESYERNFKTKPLPLSHFAVLLKEAVS